MIVLNDYFICKPCQLPETNSNILVSKNSDCFAKVYAAPNGHIKLLDKVIWYDRSYAKTCTISGENYIAISKEDIIAVIDGD